MTVTDNKFSDASRAKVCGFWRLVGVTAAAIPSGDPIDPGGSPAGYIYYDPSGFMLVFMTRGERPMPAGEIPSTAECERLMKTMTSYAGRWRLDPDASTEPDAGVLYHEVEVSWNELWTGSAQRREFRMEGNRLSLSTAQPDQHTGVPIQRSLIWERV
jgi:Lipocalin-like domain